MNASIRNWLAAAAWLASLAVYAATAGTAAPRAVEAFDAGTWAGLQAQLQQPAVLVFSTTDCAHCPAVLQRLAQDIRQRRLKAALMAVVMDQGPGDDDAALLANPHYAQADRLFAFAAQAPAIRYAIDPRWRGVTPYVVFLAPGRSPRAVTGPPSTADIDAWVRRFPAR